MTDAELNYLAFSYWANSIETGRIELSARDAIESKQPQMVRNLQPEQKELVERLRALAEGGTP